MWRIPSLYRGSEPTLSCRSRHSHDSIIWYNWILLNGVPTSEKDSFINLPGNQRPEGFGKKSYLEALETKHHQCMHSMGQSSSEEKLHDRTGNWSRDILDSSEWLWPLDHVTSAVNIGPEGSSLPLNQEMLYTRIQFSQYHEYCYFPTASVSLCLDIHQKGSAVFLNSLCFVSI